MKTHQTHTFSTFHHYMAITHRIVTLKPEETLKIAVFGAQNRLCFDTVYKLGV